MAALQTSSIPLSRFDPAEHRLKGGLAAEIITFFRQFAVAAFDPYRPELHYMRGPGPACRAREASK